MGGNDCPWLGWDSRAEGAGTWDLAEMKEAGHCGSDSGPWRVGGGCVEPVVQPADCGVPKPSLLSENTTRVCSYKMKHSSDDLEQIFVM